MKKAIFLLTFLSFITLSFSQQYKEMIDAGTYTVHEISASAEAYFEIRGKGKGTGYKQFKRWEYNALRNMDVNGYLPTTEDEFYRFAEAEAYFGAMRSADDSNWEELGPTNWNSTSGWNPGVGRITSFAVQESNQQHIIVGSPTGGVWRTINGGGSWTVLTDNFINMEVNALAMHPTNTSTYFWGSNSGIIFKTEDSGATWNQIASLPGNSVNKFLIHPSNPDIMFCTVSNSGVYKSTDGGDNWNNVIPAMNSGYDVEFKPNDTNTVYATGTSFYRSTDGGDNFSIVAAPFDGDVKMIGVSPANASTVYIVEANGGIFNGFYVSTNSGQSFSKLNHGTTNYFGYSDTGNDTSGQAPRDMDIVVSPTDINEVHIAGIHTWRSLNGGSSFSLTSFWSEGGSISRNIGYCHADVDIMQFVGDDLYVGSDGGLYINNDSDGTINTSFYTDLTSGLGIRQFYKIGVSQTDPEKITGGSQDNGTSYYSTSGNWFDWLGADGMETFIDKNNNNIFYGTSQFGSLYKSTNGGAGYSGIGTPDGKSGDWVTPFEQDPTTNNVIYAGYDQVYKSTNGGSSWSAISQVFGGGNMDQLKIAPSNNQVIYGSVSGALYKTTNGGATNWTSLSGYGGSHINSIAIHPTNPNMVAIATNATNKVYVSEDGGSTWTDQLLNLPNFTAQALVWENSTSNRLYVGMNYGIYYIDDLITEWQVFATNLPNVRIYELEINTSNQMLYAGTYGRGAWRSPLARNTPVIGLLSSEGNELENSDCSFTDHQVTIGLSKAPSADATLTFNVNGSSTATEGIDFDVMTPSITFSAGVLAQQQLVVRVYHDAFIEGDETIVLDATLDANGGDAALNSEGDSYVLTITDDDSAPIVTEDQALLTEDFEDASDWTSIDADGDGVNWLIWEDQGWATHQYSGRFAVSQSWAGSPLSPDNYYMSPQVTIPTNSTDASVSYVIGSYNTNTYYLERYSVYFTTDISNETAIQNGLVLENNRQIPANGTELRSHDLLAAGATPGQTGYFVVRHHNVTDQWILGLDTVTLEATVVTNVQTAINDTTTFDELQMNDSGVAYASDSASSNIMLGIINNTTFDYGCTTVAVSRQGNSAQSYGGSVSPDFVTDKTFEITPVNTTSSGNTSITFYFTEAEVAGWETATGLSRSNLVVARGNASSVTETSALTLGAFGTDVTLTGNFTGIEGTYYFGTTNTFASCLGDVKTWNGTAWSPVGTPTNSNTVVLAAPYDFVNGNITACSLIVNSGVDISVPANNFIQVEGTITVDGTLTVEHQGSIVQINDAAAVVNNGTIQVEVSTPDLNTRDFMVMGSPMTSEDRNGVWDSAFLVLDHNTHNFVPNPQVAAQFPGAENFADDNYDAWSAYVGAINPAEGYIVRPQTSYTGPGGVFDFTYEAGTLNNGIHNFNIIYNTPGPTGVENKIASPNVVANPYPSAISASAFINANAMVDEIYFWEHLTPPSASLPGAGSMNFSMEDISMYNLMGGTAAAADPSGIDTEPNGVISTAQGFGFKANSSGTAIFNNSMRLSTGNTTLRTLVDTDRIWIALSNENYDLQDVSLIGFSENCSPALDQGYDSKRLATVLSLYSHLEDGSEELGIQSREAFDPNIEIKMGFSTLLETDTEYTISIAKIEGALIENATAYLLDKQEQVLTNLSEENYTFGSYLGTFHERFILMFETAPVLGVASNLLTDIVLYPNPTQDVFNIQASSAKILEIKVHDMLGRTLIQHTEKTPSELVQLDVSAMQAATYFVEIVTSQGAITKQLIKK